LVGQSDLFPRKLAAERIALSRADFNTNETVNVHILNETTDVVSPVNGEDSRYTLEAQSKGQN